MSIRCIQCHFLQLTWPSLTWSDWSMFQTSHVDVILVWSRIVMKSCIWSVSVSYAQFLPHCKLFIVFFLCRYISVCHAQFLPRCKFVVFLCILFRLLCTISSSCLSLQFVESMHVGIIPFIACTVCRSIQQWDKMTYNVRICKRNLICKSVSVLELLCFIWHSCTFLRSTRLGISW